MTRRYWPLILAARRRLGRVVPLHQGRRRRRLLAGCADVLADADRRHRPARLPRGHARRRDGRAAAARGLATAVVLGLLNAAVPFWLIAWGEKYIDSGTAGIAQATVPIFSLLIGLRFLPHERIGPRAWRGSAWASSASPSSPVEPRGRRVGGRRNACGRARLRLLRRRRDLQPARDRRPLGAGARDRLHARGERVPAPARAPAPAGEGCRRPGRSSRCFCSPSSGRRSRSSCSSASCASSAPAGSASSPTCCPASRSSTARSSSTSASAWRPSPGWR